MEAEDRTYGLKADISAALGEIRRSLNTLNATHRYISNVIRRLEVKAEMVELELYGQQKINFGENDEREIL